VTLFGGAPGAGKSALTMQLVVDALRATSTLRAVVCNIEMPTSTLLDRQLARLSGVDLTLIRHRRLNGEHSDAIDRGLNTLESIADRLAFVRQPFNLENVAHTADEFQADLLLLDYIQRIPPPDKHSDKRGAIDATMNYLREFAEAGFAVLVVAAVSRSRDSKGRSSYSEGLNLASFRESSELEFGCDDAFILIPEEGENADTVNLRHLKSRHGEALDMELQFQRRCQRFTPIRSSKPDPNLKADLAKLWEKQNTEESDGEE
jgi:replicative DNA helicase